MSKVNEFVSNFLTTNNSKDLLKKWNTEETQRSLSSLVSSSSARSASKKTSEMKDPNRPKRANSAYMFFQKDMRSAMKETHPTATMTDATKIIAAKWKETSEKERVKYQQMADRDKERHASEMKAYVPAEEFSSAGRKPKDPNAPKRQTAYHTFASAERTRIKADHPDWDSKRVTARVSELWKEHSSSSSDNKSRSAPAKQVETRDDDEDEVVTSDESSEEEEEEEEEPVVAPKKSSRK